MNFNLKFDKDTNRRTDDIKARLYYVLKLDTWVFVDNADEIVKEYLLKALKTADIKDANNAEIKNLNNSSVVSALIMLAQKAKSK